jgi:hypothetical protein
MEHNKNISRAGRKKRRRFDPGSGSARGDPVVSQFEFPLPRPEAVARCG